MAGLLSNPSESPEALIQQGMEDDGLDETAPVFKAAMQFVYTALYEKGAADKYAKAISQSQDKAQALSDIAYQVCDVVLAKSKGALPSELLPLLASHVLNELVSVAETAGSSVSPDDIAGALEKMMLRLLEESGMDTAELRAAIDAAKAGGGAPPVAPNPANAPAQEAIAPASQAEQGMEA